MQLLLILMAVSLSLACSSTKKSELPARSTIVPSATPEPTATPAPVSSGAGVTFKGVTVGDQPCDMNAVISQDGKRIAFVRAVVGSGNTRCASVSGAVMVVNSDGTGLKQVAPRGSYPQWSPDGTSLLFDVWFQGTCSGSLVAMDIDSGRTRTVRNSIGHDGNWWWSSDGQFVLTKTCVFNVDTDESRPLILDLNGRVVQTFAADLRPVAFSTQGKAILQKVRVVITPGVSRSDERTGEYFLASPEASALEPLTGEVFTFSQRSWPWGQTKVSLGR